MKPLVSVLILLAIAATAYGDDSDESWEIHGRVVDEHGQPVENFEAAAWWSSNGKMWDEAGQPIETNGQADLGKIWKDEGVLAVHPRYLATRLPGGKFSLKVEGWPRKAVLVTDQDHRRGGCVVVEKAERATSVTVTLRPLVRVQGRIYCPEASRTPDWTAVKVHAVADLDNCMGLTLCGSLKGEFSLLLPPGKYDIGIASQSPDGHMPRPKNAPDDMPAYLHGIRLEVPAGQDTLDLGVLFVEFGEGKGDSPRGDYSKHYGKEPPPLVITDACGVDRNVKLADYRGKWVLLDFWTLGCTSCVERSLPDLAKFYSEYADDRDRFEILAICVTDNEKATTREQFEVLVAPIVKNVWNGKQLPFPVLIDGEGKTLNAYGVQGVPSTLLIDPHGNLVKFGDDVLLAEKLKEKRP